LICGSHFSVASTTTSRSACIYIRVDAHIRNTLRDLFFSFSFPLGCSGV
jgi:hypothetical protein